MDGLFGDGLVDVLCGGDSLEEENLQNFTTSQFYLNYLISFFDIFAISEHCLFEEQLGFIKSATENTFNCHAVCAYDNPPILSGDNPHGGVALLWKCSINDWVTPLEDIISDRIVGIRLDFPKCDPLFILGVYLPATSAKHTLDDYLQYLHYLWAIYDKLSSEVFVVILGDFNGI